MKLLSTFPLLAILSVATFTFAAPISNSPTVTSSLANRSLIDEVNAVLQDLGLGDADAKDPDLLDSLQKALQDLGLRKRSVISELGQASTDLGLGDPNAEDGDILDSIAKAESDLGL